MSVLGASLPRVLMPALPGNNDVGFFEPSRIVEIHDELLAAAGSTWHDPSPLPEAWFRSPAARAFGQRLRAAYVEEYGDARLTVLKDPRICRFLPLWREIMDSLNVTPLFVIPFRHPMEVAASLARRDGFPSRKSQVLWLQHVLLAEEATRGCGRGFIAYEELLSDPRTALARLGRDLAVDWPSPVEEVLPQLQDFLARRHHHNRAFSWEGPRPEDPAGLVGETYSILEKLVGTPSPDQEDAFDRFRAAYLRSDELHGPLVRSLEVDLHRARQEFEERRLELSRALAAREGEIGVLVEQARVRELDLEKRLQGAQTAISERDGQIAALSHLASDRDSQLRESLTAAASRDRQIQCLSQTLTEREGQIRRAAELGEARERDLEEARATIAARDQAVAAAHDLIRQKSFEAARLGETARDLEAQLRGGLTTISDLRASTSWRITYPLRALKRLSKGGG